MNKKRYEAPVLKKVRLVVKNAILAQCHDSPVMDPKGIAPCSQTPGCYNAPTP